MLYSIAHFLKNKLPCIWMAVEWLNSVLFTIRYGHKLQFVPILLNEYSDEWIVRQANLHDVDALITFFDNQPASSYKYFNPHKFDAKTIRQLIKNKSYFFFIVIKDNVIVGYYFLRCFFIGRCYLGKIVDYQYRGKGIGKLMCKSSMNIASYIGLRMFETISKDNLASLYSTKQVLNVRVICEMDNNYLYIEDFPK